MANFKKRRHNGRHASPSSRPWKFTGQPPDYKFRMSELRRLGGRKSRLRRRDVDWSFRED